MVSHVRVDNALQLLATCSLERLRAACLRTIATNFMQIVRNSRAQLDNLIEASAKEIEARQEYDTVPLVDDIRYHLDQVHIDLRDADGLGFGEDDDAKMEELVESAGPLQWSVSGDLVWDF